MILEQETLPRLVGLAAGIHVKTQRIAERALHAHALTYAQFGALAAIAERDGSTQRELAEKLETDANTVMVICDSLEKKGLVVRRSDPADRRIRRISMTPRGGRLFTKALSTVQGLYRPLSAAFPEKDILPALPLLQRLYAYLKEKERT